MRQQAENRQARGLYLQALRIDPDFGRALGGIALTYAADYRNRWSEDGQAALSRAKRTAQEAARLNPDLPEVLWVDPEQIERFISALLKPPPAYPQLQ